MTRFFTFVFTLFFSINLFAQIELDSCVGGFNFYDETLPLKYLYLDSVNNAQNIWQIGTPEKDNILLPFTPSRSIVTDTMFSYPTNDTSSFIIAVCHYYQGGFLPYLTVSNWELNYYMDSDEGNDFGKIEVSVDNGDTWWNLNEAGWISGDTILSGNTGGLAKMRFDPTFDPTPTFYDHMMTVSNNMTIPIESMWIRFTFISDNIAENKMGWIIESLNSGQGLFSSVNDIKRNSIGINIFPNPTSGLARLEIQNKELNNYSIQLFSSTGALVHQTSIENGFQKELNLLGLPQGIYHFMVTNQENLKKGFGKVVITE